MQQKNLVIRDPLGLHARPAGLLAKAAQRYSCDIHLSIAAKGKRASAKKLFELMSLEAAAGDELLLQTDGEDEQQALEAIGTLIAERLG
jgi:phosphocarrier protein